MLAETVHVQGVRINPQNFSELARWRGMFAAPRGGHEVCLDGGIARRSGSVLLAVLALKLPN